MTVSIIRERYGQTVLTFRITNVQGIYQVFKRKNDMFLSHDAFYHHQFITLFLYFFRCYYSVHCGSWRVERARDVLGALFVKTLDYFYLLFRCNHFAIFSTIFFNNFEVRMLETKRRSTGKSFTGETFCRVCTWSFVTTRYVMHGLKRALFVTVKLQNFGEEPSSVSDSVTTRSWPMCSTHFGTENELTWDVLLQGCRINCASGSGLYSSLRSVTVVESKLMFAFSILISLRRQRKNVFSEIQQECTRTSGCVIIVMGAAGAVTLCLRELVAEFKDTKFYPLWFSI